MYKTWEILTGSKQSCVTQTEWTHCRWHTTRISSGTFQPDNTWGNALDHIGNVKIVLGL